MGQRRRIQIAIDGPVGAGKTSVGRLVARRLGMSFVDTGLTYRAVTLAALRRGVAVDDPAALGRFVEDVRIELKTDSDGEPRVLVDGKDVSHDLRSPEIDRSVSTVSAVPEVRRRMVDVQRDIAAAGSIVMAGRDIGTVVLPEADLKVFLTAGDETRARRRHQEVLSKGGGSSYGETLDALRRRDRIDSEREASPLRPAKGARIVDTDGMTLEEVVTAVCELATAEMTPKA
jgi:cytidylate kinase